MPKCVSPSCKEEGTFPAPCDPRHIAERQYLCEAHIKEFNKKWNGLDGFAMEEIFEMQHGGATWNRPTWKMGTNSESYKAAASTFESAEDLYQFFKQRHINGATVSPRATKKLPADVEEACRIFAIEKPVVNAQLKQKYLTLVKKNHPDLAPNADLDLIKRINVAYRILQEYTVSTS